MTHYLIDGYNWLFRSTQRSEERLRIEREQLTKELSAKLSIAGMQATIVYDSHFQPGPAERSVLKGISIYYTHEGETADDYILEFIKHVSKPKGYTVVTSDLRLAWGVRQCGGQSLDIPAFKKILDRIYKKKKMPPKKPSPPKPFTPKRTLQDYYEQAFDTQQPEVPKKRKISDYERWKKAFEDGA